MTQAGRSAPRRVARCGLVLGACFGVLCIAGVVASRLAGVSLVMFETGSMSPSMPRDSVALVRSVRATSVRVGDVVTVPRRDEPSVTHRVVSVRHEPGGVTQLVLKGDANRTTDPAPYRVRTVGQVIGSIKGLAPGLAALQSPIVVAIASLIVIVLVASAYWPTAEDEQQPTPASD